MDHDETGCQAAPEGPILCVNNCGFFGSVATMNMCSKCYKDTVLKQEHAKLAASSFDNIVNGSPASAIIDKQPMNLTTVRAVEPKPISTSGVAEETPDAKPNQNGPSRCTTCQKRVGLTGFKCKCGNLFCSLHRYSDKHECAFDYQGAARVAIARANPVVKAEKLDKI